MSALSIALIVCSCVLVIAGLSFYGYRRQVEINRSKELPLELYGSSMVEMHSEGDSNDSDATYQGVHNGNDGEYFNNSPTTSISNKFQSLYVNDEEMPSQYTPSLLENQDDLLFWYINEERIKQLEPLGSSMNKGLYDGSVVALKLLKSSEIEIREEQLSFVNSIRLWSTLRHSKIVEFIGLTWDWSGDITVVLEFMNKCSLHDLMTDDVINDWSWIATEQNLGCSKLSISIDIVEALMYLHTIPQAAIHGNIKSSTILLNDDWVAKLSNIGLFQQNKPLASDSLSSVWVAPEILRGENFTIKVDMYSVGVLLSALDNTRTFESEIASGLRPITSSFSATCPHQLVTVAQHCLEMDPEKRPNAMEILYELRKLQQDILLAAMQETP